MYHPAGSGMKLLFINPNSSKAVTERIAEATKKYEDETTRIDVIACQNSPEGIVTAADELTAGVNVIQLLQEKEKEYDGAVIACFADPGLRAAREKIKIPVAGIYEASAVFAKLQASRYSIISSGDHRDMDPWVLMARSRGEVENIASIKCLNSTVEQAVHADEEKLLRLIGACVKKDGAGSVILGCAAFAGQGDKLSQRSEVPVIDGIKEAVFFIRMMILYRK